MSSPAPTNSTVADAAPQEKEKKSCLSSQLQKTRFCMYQAKGTCQYGDACGFAHSQADLQVAPNLKKTRLCEAFAEGKCDNPNCSFAHGELELRSSEVFYKKTLCIWNAKGKCRNGDQCRFAHGKRQLRVAPIPDPVEDASKNRAPSRVGSHKSPGDSVSVHAPPQAVEPMKIQSKLGLDTAAPPPLVPVMQSTKPPQSKAEVKAELARLRQCVADLTSQCTQLKKVLYQPQNESIDYGMLANLASLQMDNDFVGNGKDRILEAPPGLGDDWYGTSDGVAW